MWHLMWRLAYETGMRQGSVSGLTNSEIQLIDNVILHCGRMAVEGLQQCEGCAGYPSHSVPGM